MTNSDFPPSDLTKEKSLWDIYKAARSIPSTPFNRAIVICSLGFIVLEIFVSTRPTPLYLKDVRELSLLGLQIGLSTLGFLIAGFTIFATISKPTLSISMSQIKHPDLEMSFLKKNYYVFMRVFIYYIAFCFFCFSLYALGKPHGIIASLVNLSPSAQVLKDAISRISYGSLLMFYVVILIQLKSFIFNTYHSVMTSLRWESES